MKIRLIRNAEQNLQLLYSDGTIAEATADVLSKLLTGFKRYEKDFSAGDAGFWNSDCFDMSDYPGETCAYLTDNGMLVVTDDAAFKPVTDSKTKPIGYMSTADFAKQVNRSQEIIKVFCRNGRIPGAIKVANSWLVPENAEYPVDVVDLRTSIGRRSEISMAETVSSEKSDDSKALK